MKDVVVMQTDCFRLPIVHHGSAGGASVKVLLFERVEYGAEHVRKIVEVRER
jgi:hypothetical protein